MKHLGNAGLGLVCLVLTAGCSQHLHRLEARHLIDAALKLRPAGPGHLMTTGYLPGFRMEDSGVYSVDNFQLGTVAAIADSDPSAALYHALAAAGYITVAPVGDSGSGDSDSIDVAIGPKAGHWHSEGTTQVYDAGFRCFSIVRGNVECQIPPLVVAEPKHYRIAQIEQDGDRARVTVMIPWKLTPLALDLRSWAIAHQEPTYDPYWESAVRHHDAEGMTPATLWFQRFPSGWQIVDENGMTEEQFNQMAANR